MRQPLPRGVYKIAPENFVVQELVTRGRDIVAIPIHSKTWLVGCNDSRAHTLMHMTKRGVATPDALRRVAQGLGVSEDSVSCHGLKDRHALTSQAISVSGAFAPLFEDSDIVLSQQMGALPNALRIGGNAGNRFAIRVQSDATSIDECALAEVPNLFGHQRFGNGKAIDAGRMIFEGQLEEAVELMQRNGVCQLRSLAQRTGSLATALYHPSMAFEVKIKLQAWQSHLWNRLVNQLGPHAPPSLPVWWTDPKVRNMYAHLWDPDFVDPRALARVVPFHRPTTVRPNNLSVVRANGDWDFKFDLPSGAYATVVLGQVFTLAEAKHKL